MQEMKPIVHVMGISGGKDSSALAVYVRRRLPEIHAQMHYYFCDTGEELPETYEYLDSLEVLLGKPISRLNPDKPFSHYLKMHGNLLPSPRQRWCTSQLKIKPFEKWLEREFGDAPILSYVAIRADENRDGYMSHRENVRAVYPFKEAGVDKEGVFRILEEEGVGLPKYYEWRTRSGCYFCFFQRKVEWANLKDRHPELYEEAKRIESGLTNLKTGEPKNYSWSQGEWLSDLEKPERVKVIREMHEKAMEDERRRRKPSRLIEMFEDVLGDEDDTEPCAICHL